jgi:glycosyltransferase involved in cell wall biosynthesis
MKGDGTRVSSDDSSPDRLSVVHLCAPAEVGGLERVVQGLASGLDARGHDITVVAVVESRSASEALFSGIADGGVDTVAVEIPGRAYLRERRSVGELLDALSPDVLHTHGYRPDLLHGSQARRRGIATVSTLHGSSRMGGLSGAFEWLQERSLRRFDAVIAVSPPLSSLLARRGVPRERIHLIPNAWTPTGAILPSEVARRRLGVPEGAEVVIGWVGRLIPIKGADVLLTALARTSGERWFACIVGGGPERARLEGLCSELGLSDRLRFCGPVEDAGRLFSAFDLFVLSSRSEGTPMVLLEAMSSGTPIVATQVGGIPDMLDADVDAWLVPPEDPAALSTAIEEALSDPSAAAERAGRSLEKVRTAFDPCLWIEHHEHAYREAVRVRRGSG